MGSHRRKRTPAASSIPLKAMLSSVGLTSTAGPSLRHCIHLSGAHLHKVSTAIHSRSPICSPRPRPMDGMPTARAFPRASRPAVTSACRGGCQDLNTYLGLRHRRHRRQHPQPGQGWNENPKPFIWTKAADQILESIALLIKRTTGAGLDSRRRMRRVPSGSTVGTVKDSSRTEDAAVLRSELARFCSLAAQLQAENARLKRMLEPSPVQVTPTDPYRPGSSMLSVTLEK